MTVSEILMEIVVGLSGGIVVGSGFVSFIIVLDLIPRLVQLSEGQSYVREYEWALISGATLWTLLDQFNINIHLPGIVVMALGTIAGIFIGMLAAALAEVLNVIPILAKRINLSEKILVFLIAILMGKVLGSFFQWIYFE